MKTNTLFSSNFRLKDLLTLYSNWIYSIISTSYWHLLD